MSYYEYILTAELTPQLEEQTTKLLAVQNDANPFYNIINYSDEDVSEGKKRRTFVLISPSNVWNFFFNHFKDSSIEIKVYVKQRLI